MRAFWSENSESFSCARSSEGNLILVDLVGGAVAAGVALRHAGGRSGREAGTTLGLEELEGLTNHAQLGAFLTRSLVLPRVELETAVDEERRALGEPELLEELSHLAPKGDIDVGDLLALLA